MKSVTHVSTWHNILAARSGADSLILDNQIIRATDLKNESVVNQQLRFLEEDEKLLGVFHIFGDHFLQCLDEIQFELNDHTTACNPLQTIPLPKDFNLEFQGKTIYKRHAVAHIDQIADNWMDDFSFDNLPKTVMDENDPELSVYHPYVDPLILNEAGQISVEKISGLTVGTILSFFMIICLWKFPSVRGFLYNNLVKCGHTFLQLYDY